MRTDDDCRSEEPACRSDRARCDGGGSGGASERRQPASADAIPEGPGGESAAEPDGPHVADAYRRLLESTTDAVFAVDKDWTVTCWNEGAAARTGVAAEHAVGRSLWAVLDDDLPAALESRYREAMRTGDSSEFEQYLGEPHDCWLSVRVLADEAGLVVAARETTQRRERERELERQEFRFDRAQEFADVGVWEYDVEADRLYWSEGVKSVYGVDPAHEPTVADAVAHTHPDDREVVETATERVLETGEWADIDYRVCRPDGETRHVRVRGETIPDEDGGVAVVRGIVQDVTEQTRHELALAELQHRTTVLAGAEEVTEACSVAVAAGEEVVGAELTGVYLRSDDGSRLEPVAAATVVEEAFGEAPTYAADAVDDPAAAVVWAAFRAGRPRVIEDTRAEGRLGETSPVRSAIVLPLGEHGVLVLSAMRPGSFSGTDNRLADILAAALTAALDRIESRAELLRKNERLETFTGVVSHDLRNPLNAAVGWTEVARESGSSEAFERVERAHARMEALVADLLSLSRQGRPVSGAGPVSLPAVVGDAWGSVDTADATLLIRTDATVVAEEPRLRQLVENLVRNAVEHGGPGVTVTVSDTDDGFAVADDGPGVPAEDRGRVTDRGYTTAEDGTGYGLAIVAEVAAAHGWRLAVEESESGGARLAVSGVTRAP